MWCRRLACTGFVIKRSLCRRATARRSRTSSCAQLLPQLEFAKIDLSRHRPSPVWFAIKLHATGKNLLSLDEERIKSCGRKRYSCRPVSEFCIDFAGELVRVGFRCSTSAAICPGGQIQGSVFLEFAACRRDIGRRETTMESNSSRPGCPRGAPLVNAPHEENQRICLLRQASLIDCSNRFFRE